MYLDKVLQQLEALAGLPGVRALVDRHVKFVLLRVEEVVEGNLAGLKEVALRSKLLLGCSSQGKEARSLGVAKDNGNQVGAKA